MTVGERGIEKEVGKKKRQMLKRITALLLTAAVAWTGMPVYAEESLEMTAADIAEEMYYDSLELLAICVEAEAADQGLEGKRMVVDVILNRVDDADWPDDIVGVISQPYHFTSYWDGGMSKVVPSEETFEAVRMELQERSWPGLYYFTSDGYSKYGTPWRQVGDHYFSTK